MTHSIDYILGDEKAREKFRSQMVSTLPQNQGNLELRASDEEVSLVGSDEKSFYSHRLSGHFNNREADFIVEDLISAAKRVGYAPSLVHRFLLNFLVPFPNKIPLTKH